MKKLIMTALFSVILSSPIIASEVKNNELSSEEMVHVVSGVITLKAQCKNQTEDSCKQADAIMKLLKSHTLAYGKSDGKLKNNAGLLLESLVDGYVEASAEASK